MIKQILNEQSKSNTLQNIADALAVKCYGRSLTDVHSKQICIQCGCNVNELKDDEIRVGYEISGLCKKCQHGHSIKQSKKIHIIPARRKILKRELAERMRIRRRKAEQRHQHYYK